MFRTKIRRGVLVSFLSSLVLLSCLELGLRLVGFSHPVVEVPIAIWNPQGDREMQDENSLHRPEVRQLWGPRPGARVTPGGDERINEAGWRGPLVLRERTPGVLRIATMGDSSVFGLHVAWEETFTAQLARLLDEGGRQVEVLGCGVIGSTTRMGVWRYRELVRTYRPDIIILGYGAINDHFPGFISDEAKIERNIWRARPLPRFARTLRDKLRILHLAAFVVDAAGDKEDRMLGWITREAERQVEGGMDPKASSWKGVRRVSVDEFGELMGDLIREVRADGAEPILISMPRTRAKEAAVPVLADYSVRLGEVAASEKADLVDVRTLFRDVDRSGQAEDELFVPGDPVHPSPQGHLVIARALLPVVRAIAEARASKPKTEPYWSLINR